LAKSDDVKAANERLHQIVARHVLDNTLKRAEATGAEAWDGITQRTSEAATRNLASAVSCDAEDAEARVAKSRAFQIEAIVDMMRRQDEVARLDGGVRPFPDRMTFATTLESTAGTIRNMIPRPGGDDLHVYREYLKGIAANCVREMERLRREGSDAL
jgi:hypothetical protein